MSSHSQLTIKKEEGKYVLRFIGDIRTGKGFVLMKADTLEEAKGKAMEYSQVYSIKYGLKIIGDEQPKLKL